MGVYFDLGKKQITKKINELLQNGSYKDINSIRDKWPKLDAFCAENNLSSIFSRDSFSSQFTNDNYLNLLKQLEDGMKLNKNNENKIVETKVGDKVFIDYNNGEQQQTLVGVESVNKEDTDSITYEQEKKFEKNILNTEKISQVNTNQLNNEQLETYNIELKNAIATDNVENTNIIKDEYGNMTNTVQVTNDNGNSYYTVDEVNGSKDLVVHEASETKSTGEKSNVKVKTLSNGHNISGAFTNTLILSFIIGSFFGIVFLAIYIKVMH